MKHAERENMGEIAGAEMIEICGDDARNVMNAIWNLAFRKGVV